MMHASVAIEFVVADHTVLRREEIPNRDTHVASALGVFTTRRVLRSSHAFAILCLQGGVCLDGSFPAFYHRPGALMLMLSCVLLLLRFGNKNWHHTRFSREFALKTYMLATILARRTWHGVHKTSILELKLLKQCDFSRKLCATCIFKLVTGAHDIVRFLCLKNLPV